VDNAVDIVVAAAKSRGVVQIAGHVDVVTALLIAGGDSTATFNTDVAVLLVAILCSGC